MTTEKKDVVGLAKKTTTKKPAAKKPATKRKPLAKKTVVEKTPEEIRDLKAKETVKTLLEDSPIVTLNSKEEIPEETKVDETISESPKGVEWLEEQVATLSREKQEQGEIIQRLQDENQSLRTGGNVPDGNTNESLVRLFDELQENFLKMGINSQGEGNFYIKTPGFLNRMVKFFPFLEKNKRY